MEEFIEDLKNRIIEKDREAIRDIRRRIKEKSKEQIKEKKRHKGAYSVFERRMEITALLNLFHEIRGTGSHHEFKNGIPWVYRTRYKQLSEEFEKGELQTNI